MCIACTRAREALRSPSVAAPALVSTPEPVAPAEADLLDGETAEEPTDEEEDTDADD